MYYNTEEHLLAALAAGKVVNAYHALYDACDQGWLSSVTLLLTDARIKHIYGQFTIQAASVKGHAKVVRLLLADGRANPRADDSGSLRWACLCGHVEVVRMLLADGRSNPAPRWGASMREYARVVRELLTDARARRDVVVPASQHRRSAVLRMCGCHTAWWACAK